MLGPGSASGEVWSGAAQGRHDNGSTLECTLPALCMISSPGAYAENTAPHAASQQLEFSYV